MCEIHFDNELLIAETRSLAQAVLHDPPADDWQKLAKGLYKNLKGINEELVKGTITISEWQNRFDSLLTLGHVNAHMAGQRIGGRTPFGPEAQRMGKMIRDTETQWLTGFVADLLDGRYQDGDSWRDNALHARSMLYVMKTRSTAYYGFTFNSPAENYDWVLGAAEDNCEDCPVLASRSPWTTSTLFTFPGEGETNCFVNCRCHLVRLSDGQVGPLPFYAGSV